MFLKKQVLVSEGIGKQVFQVFLNKEKVDIVWCGFFMVLVLIVVSVVVKVQEKKVDGGLVFFIDKKVFKCVIFIVFVGVLSFCYFVQYCMVCQFCVLVCFNQVLCLFGDLKYLMQFEMFYECGYCCFECVKCVEVCFIDVIYLVDLIEKLFVQIGYVVWVVQNCIVNIDGVSCGNCVCYCFMGVILMVFKDVDDGKLFKILVVNIECCIGCGVCENFCLSCLFSVIYVEGYEMYCII